MWQSSETTRLMAHIDNLSFLGETITIGGLESMSEIVILLPTKNEEEGVGEVIDRVPLTAIEEMGYRVRVVVVDGSSTDSTCEIAIAKGAELIRQKSDPGKGWGFREALKVIFTGNNLGQDLLVMLDADATYSPEDIPRFIQELQECDVVWGSRLRGKIEENAMSFTNKTGNKILSFWASLVFMKKTTDLCTGFWGFRSSKLETLSISAKGFTLEAELFALAIKNELVTKEIPIDYAHRSGESNLKWYIDGPRIFFATMKKRFEYGRRPIHDAIYISAFSVLFFSAIGLFS